MESLYGLGSWSFGLAEVVLDVMSLLIALVNAVASLLMAIIVGFSLVVLPGVLSSTGLMFADLGGMGDGDVDCCARVE